MGMCGIGSGTRLAPFRHGHSVSDRRSLGKGNTDVPLWNCKWSKTTFNFQGDQILDMSKTHLGFPYLINFSNLTQRWLTNGYVRSVRRMKQAPYPLVKVRLEELAPVTGEYFFTLPTTHHSREKLNITSVYFFQLQYETNHYKNEKKHF